MPFYPLYAVYFADAGLSGAQIGSLFVLWSAATFTLEVPSGAWADTFSRRHLVAVGGLLRAVGFGLWTCVPTYWSFAAGFLCWAAQSAFKSGSVEALVYDELVAQGATDHYLRIVGRAEAWARIGMVTGTALAVLCFALGGYRLIGAVSVAMCVANALVAGSLPDRRAGSGTRPSYAVQLRAGLREARVRPLVRRLILLGAVLSGLGAVDEYVPLLVRGNGVRTGVLPLVFLLPTLAMAAAGWFADRAARLRARWLGAGVALSAVLLVLGALGGTAFGLAALTGFFGLWQVTVLVLEVRLQDAIEASARATVLSVLGFAAEAVALALYAAVGLGAGAAGLPLALAALALPLLAVGASLTILQVTHRSEAEPGA